MTRKQWKMMIEAVGYIYYEAESDSSLEEAAEKLMDELWDAEPEDDE